MNITNLPNDIIFSFCEFLNLKDILVFAQVSKRFSDSKKYITKISIWTINTEIIWASKLLYFTPNLKKIKIHEFNGIFKNINESC